MQVESANASSRVVPPDMADRLIVALDVPTIAAAHNLADRLADTVSCFKIGLWLAFAEGIDGFLGDLLRRGKRIFLDTKMYDIGQTVEQGIARAAERGISFATVHGDPAMLQAAVRGRGHSALKVLAVTVLTSLDDRMVQEMGYRMNVADLVRLRTRQAVESGCDGIIAAPHDRPDDIRRQAGAPGLLVATPGVRPSGSPTDDHSRSATPGQAISYGADYLIVGRPILRAPDPAAQARAIIGEMRAAAAIDAGGQ
jgi:orotidine-5'-phosphate decarboxylase